jgi:hypothetical protein
MRIVRQSYPAIGGPTDGRMITTSWSRVWVHVDARTMRAIEWSGDLIEAMNDADVQSDAGSPLQQCTQYLCPDAEVGAALLDIVGNASLTVDAAIQEIDGVYAFDHELLALRWVQVKSAAADAAGSPASRFRLLLEFALREHALAEHAHAWVGRPDDALPLRIMRAHPDDPDVQLRATTFNRRRAVRWARFGMPPTDGPDQNA